MNSGLDFRFNPKRGKILEITEEVEKEKGKIILKLKGELDMHSAKIFREKTNTIIEKDNIFHFVLDLQEVSTMDSMGLGAIVGLLKKIKKKNQSGAIQLINIKKGSIVEKILNMSGLDKFFIIPQLTKSKEDKETPMVSIK